MSNVDQGAVLYVRKLLERATGRTAAQACAQKFVQDLIQKALAAKAIQGAAKDVASLCAREAVKHYVDKAAEARSQQQQGAEEAAGHARDVAAGCARVAAARWLAKAQMAMRSQGAPGPERASAAACAKGAVERWVAKAKAAASKAGPERKVAAACARVAVARFVEKAKQSVRVQGKERAEWSEAAKRNQSKAFEETVAQGDEREVAAMCARHAVKCYVNQACDALRQGAEAETRQAVEQVHTSLMKAASRIAAVAQPTIDNLGGLIPEADVQESPSGAMSPTRPSGVAPKKKRPGPKPKPEEVWTAPPSPEHFDAEVLLAAASPKASKASATALAKAKGKDPEEERKRDVQFLQQRHLENVQRVRQKQEDLRDQSFMRVSHGPCEAPGCPRDPRLPPKPTDGRKSARASPARTKPAKARARHPRSQSERPRKVQEESSILSLPDDLLSALAEMEADMPRPDLDDPVLRAYLAVYKSTVCQRAEENGDPCLRGAGSTCEGGLSTEPEGKKRRAKSASRQLSDKKDSHWLQPGLLSWQDKAKAWFWPRKGAVPPMETAVLALLNGSPPPLEATAQAALAARQQFAMPVLQKMQQACNWAPTCTDSRSRCP
mmetsp:Transcript_84638/g.202872  ORF Transcript_84638/g.202872 Transcript_84638/m.202872 type:complete len:609 (+) Transcript_84638:53-1879(+)